MQISRPCWPEMYRNLTMPGLEEPVEKDRSLSMFYLAVALVLVFHLKQHISSESSIIFGLLCCSTGLLLFPVMVLLLLVFWSYRQLVVFWLSRKPGFVGLMDGSDAYWALEEEASKAVINILLYIKFQPKISKENADLRTVIKATMQSRLLTDPTLFKLKCTRQLSMLGYFYWQQHRADIDEHVRWMELDTATEETIEDYISSKSNDPLPYDNHSFWEVLVSRTSILKEGKMVYPVLFRVHHSIGDGISLVSMFLNSLSDDAKRGRQNVPLQNIRQKQELTRLLTKDVSKLEEVFNKVSKALGAPLAKKSSLFKMHNDFKKMNRHFIYSMTGLLQRISLLMFAPIVLTSQVLLGHDKNLIHGPKLKGEKYLIWKSSTDLFDKVKKIKDKLKCHFTDVVLLAVSNSLEKYLTKIGEPPESVILVLPARLPQEEIINGITVPTNAFTVALMRLPVADPLKLQNICWRMRKLRIGPHYLVNYWLLKVACTYMPLTFIKRGLRSKQATVALSNIPGPERLTTLDGNIIEDIVFWVPNRDTTGVGVSILSYAGKLNFGLHVDQAIIPSKESAHLIAENFIISIEKMYESIT